MPGSNKSVSTPTWWSKGNTTSTKRQTCMCKQKEQRKDLFLKILKKPKSWMALCYYK